MKKIFTLIGLAAFAFSMNAGTPQTKVSDDVVLNMSIGDASDKENVVIVVGATNVPDNCALVSFLALPPEGATFVNDKDEDEGVVVPEEYFEDWAVTRAARVDCSNYSIKDNGSILSFLNHPNKNERVFKAGDIKLCNIFLDASKLERGKGEGPNGARFYVTIKGNDEVNTIFSLLTDENDIDWTLVPESDVQLMIGVAEDGSITGIESVRANAEAKKGIYNLMGQKVNEMQAGQIYIVDGKKVMK